MTIADEIYHTHSFKVADELAVEFSSNELREETTFVFKDGSAIIFCNVTERFVHTYDYV